MERNRSRSCCLCGKPGAYHNPEPIRDISQDCCSDCNRLVINARMNCYRLPEAERAEYVQRLEKMSYAELYDELKDD